MKLDPNVPYNDLPLLPPDCNLDSPEILKKTISASRALAELKGLGITIPNQSILINSITLQEARTSSEIENVITTNDALFKAFAAKTGQIDPATKEVLHYRSALWEGYNTLKTQNLLTTNVFIRLVQTIKQNNAGVRKTTGTHLSNDKTGEVMYTPPVGESIIRDKLGNLETFIHTDDGIDPLIKLAIMHYQFEAIHPFSDGNGRTGRILNILYLVQKNLLDLPVLYLSKYIIEHKSNYYRFLRAVTTKQEWIPWILFMLDAVEQTANFSRKRILDIRNLMERTVEKAKNELPDYMYSKELIEILFHQPYCKAQFLVEANLAERKTAATYLKELERIGVLMSRSIGREKLYLNIKLYELLADQHVQSMPI
ncbi:MAG: Fic/DOC family N-terminal domain-containing protein [Candidatus Marinimicrobia bacterium]|nr:Fic/DOC family N-terminal domain-containing protein [Candidatus Neomarinimicrobiota bacterium]